MRILFVTSEIDDFIQVGGLGAVSAALPRALNKQADVRIVLPAYGALANLPPSFEPVGVCPPMGQLPACSIVKTSTDDGLTVYLVVCPELYGRDGSPYVDANGRDWADNDIRFARFSSAAALLASGRIDRQWMADLVHANDWPSALTPAYLRWGYSNIPTIFTIHNLAYQGLFSKDTLERIGAPDAAYCIDGIEFYGQASFMKAGLVYSDHLTTVSQTYAREITTPEFGCGLEGVLAKRKQANQLTGILNGIDETWDPTTCPELAAPFTAGDWTGKRRNAAHVRSEFGLAVSRGPLFALVARLVHQKGIDLVLGAAQTIVESGGQLMVMGRGEPQFEKALAEAQKRRPDSIRVALHFDDASARRIFAGSDFTLMPSRFEPCGLSQMYAQRFGSLPIGRRTGGLSETISDGETGFLFNKASAEDFLGSICRAFGTFSSKRKLNTMRVEAMSKSFSWGQSATAYGALYSRLLAGAGPVPVAAAA